MAGKEQANEMLILDGQGKELMNVRKVERDGNDLVVTGKIMGAMPMKARLTPAQARAGLKMLDWRTILFLLTLLFRKG
ncbi:hypothetical protein L288_14245 [Sphingobium quisquiliarum P25]|uniref:Uncharacterized protein n=1 Tax=Sphingobium quisquiliarum P25 TaxID=1329909 RepID=T0HY13_9SPHN|nr:MULTISPECIES: hypothetical protein [Sphingobium]EQB04235.1 hypothetical protein L288_14245 [Sphingobium quisquiliarum P25]EZP71057.1 hypothetical protein BV96_02895 [Sphingomonas paucimobilis]